MAFGKVKFYSEPKGFGFITPDNGTDDVFFHITSCPQGAEPEPGDSVEFGVEQGERGPKATNVQLTDGGDSDTPEPGCDHAWVEIAWNTEEANDIVIYECSQCGELKKVVGTE